jgi:malate synthase
MMGEMIERSGLRVAAVLGKFVDEEALPGTDVDSV